MGPLLLARLMGLNEVQEGVLAIAFRVADEQNLLLLDLGDLQAMLVWCAENADELTTKYGNVSKATVGTIQRQLLTLDSQGDRKEHTSELQSLMRISYAVFCLKKKKIHTRIHVNTTPNDTHTHQTPPHHPPDHSAPPPLTTH